MKTISAICIFCLLAIYSGGQNATADSTFVSARQKLQSALLQKNMQLQADARHELGMAFYLKQSFDSAAENFTIAADLYRQLKQAEKHALSLKFEGISLAYSGNNAKAIQSYKQALDYYLSINDSASVASLRGNLGMSYRNLSDYQLAIDQLLLALQFFEHNGDQPAQANTYNHLGNVFRDWKNLQKAQVYYQKAYDLSIQLGNASLQSSAANNLAIVSRESGDFAKAIHYYEESLKLKEKSGNLRGIASSYLGLGITYKSLKDFQKALEYYQRALDIYRNTGEKNSEAAALGNMGLLYLSMEKPGEALKKLEESNQIATATNYLELQKNNILGISEAWEMLGNHRKSLEAFKIHQQLKDSIFTAEKHRQIQELEVQFESEKKQKEIELLAVENQLKEAENASKDSLLRILIIFISLLTISIVLVLVQVFEKNKAFKLLVKKNSELSFLLSGAKPSARKLALPDEKMDELLSRLEEFLRLEKPWLKADFQLQDCAKVLETNTKYLSQAINDSYNQGFSSLLNELRVKEACIILNSEVSKSYTIEAIAHQVGFNSKSAFNAAFKRFTGVTPSYYIQNQTILTFPD